MGLGLCKKKTDSDEGVKLERGVTMCVLEPEAISNLVNYFTPGQKKLTKSDAYYNAGILLAISLYQSIYFFNYDLQLNLIGVEVRTCLCSYIFRKILRLNPTISHDKLGKIVTIITKDVQQIKSTMFVFNDLWVFSVVVMVTCYLLYSKIGAVSLVATAVYVVAIPLEVYIGKIVNKLRLKTSKSTDERLQIIQEALTAIRIIKMYTWEEFFLRKIDAARRKEVAKMVLVFYLRTILLVLGATVSKTGFYLLIMAYIWMEQPTDASIIFFIIAHFDVLRLFFGYILPDSIGKIAEFTTAMCRIHQVLTTEEINIKRIDNANLNPSIYIKNVDFTVGDLVIFNNINIDIKPGITLITGRVGTGKSTLLKIILQELSILKGSVSVQGKISYASQNPWIFPSTIKQNILFGEKFDSKRYQQVLTVCALQYDLNLFEKGDETILSDNGANLSKGQQARVNLARAVYRESDIYLLDDCLSSLDSNVRCFIYKNCIQKFLGNKICVLVTQDPSLIKNENVVYEIKNKRVEISAYKSTSNKTTYNNDDNSKDVNEETEHVKVLETEQTTQSNIYEEKLNEGAVNKSVYKKYVKYGGGYFILFINLVLMGLYQASESYSDKLLSVWTDEKQLTLNILRNISNNITSDSLDSLENAQNEAASTFKTYTVMLVVSVCLDLVTTYTFLEFCRKASINIHKAIVRNVLYGVTSFFDTHFIGNILNRFSQDVSNVDENLPPQLIFTTSLIFRAAGTLVLLVAVNPYFLLCIIIFSLALIVFLRIFLPISRNLQRLVASTRSPMLGHINAALEGMITIRSHEAKDIITDEYEKRQNVFTSAFYTLLCIQFAFGFFLDMMGMIMITTVVLSFIFFDTGASAGAVGLGITQVFSLTSTIQSLIKTYANLENIMTGTERALEYTEIKEEVHDVIKCDNWAKCGKIKFDNVSLSYNSKNMILNRLNFEVLPREKIGIVGRTGAGKSSIISTLFRLYEIEGVITIDKINIKDIPLKLLRKNLAIIPQDPFIFSGTLRENLDPYGEFNDEKLWDVIKKSNLTTNNLDDKVLHCSLGQKQMISIARAILSEAKIVILDEATANMDEESEVLINESIREHFRNCTVITIAHRLKTIMGCDKTMVMDKGEVKEFDEPGKLLRINNGLFKRLIDETGTE